VAFPGPQATTSPRSSRRGDEGAGAWHLPWGRGPQGGTGGGEVADSRDLPCRGGRDASQRGARLHQQRLRDAQHVPVGPGRRRCPAPGDARAALPHPGHRGRPTTPGSLAPHLVHLPRHAAAAADGTGGLRPAPAARRHPAARDGPARGGRGRRAGLRAGRRRHVQPGCLGRAGQVDDRGRPGRDRRDQPRDAANPRGHHGALRRLRRRHRGRADGAGVPAGVLRPRGLRGRRPLRRPSRAGWCDLADRPGSAHQRGAQTAGQPPRPRRAQRRHHRRGARPHRGRCDHRPVQVDVPRPGGGEPGHGHPAALRRHRRQPALRLPAHRPGQQPQHRGGPEPDGVDHRGVLARPDRPDLRRGPRRRPVRRRRVGPGLPLRRGPVARRSGHRLRAVHRRQRRVHHQGVPSRGRAGDDPALRGALDRHRVRHRVPLRHDHAAAGGGAHRGRPSRPPGRPARAGEGPRPGAEGPEHAQPPRLPGRGRADDLPQGRDDRAAPAHQDDRRAAAAGPVLPPRPRRRQDPLLPQPVLDDPADGRAPHQRQLRPGDGLRRRRRRGRERAHRRHLLVLRRPVHPAGGRRLPRRPRLAGPRAGHRPARSHRAVRRCPRGARLHRRRAGRERGDARGVPARSGPAVHPDPVRRHRGDPAVRSRWTRWTRPCR
jgi:hypothetical protein